MPTGSSRGSWQMRSDKNEFPTMARLLFNLVACVVLVIFLSSCSVQIQMTCIAPSRVGLYKGDTLEIQARSHLGNKVREQLTRELQQGGIYTFKENADYQLRLENVREHTWSNKAIAEDDDELFEETELSAWLYLTKKSGGPYGYAYKYTITTDGADSDIEGLCQDIARDLQPHRILYTEELDTPEGNPAFKQAADYCQAGMWQHAARIAEKAVQLTPHEPEAHYLQGLIQRQLENYAASDTCFGKAYQLKPDARYAKAIKINKLMQMGARHVRHQMQFNGSDDAAFNKGTLPAYYKKKDTPWTQLFVPMNL